MIELDLCQATYYGSKGEGTCQFSKSNLPVAARNSKYLVALNKPQFLQSAACGMCFSVSALCMY